MILWKHFTMCTYPRRAVSPIIATVLLLIAGVIVASVLHVGNSLGTDKPVYKTELSAVYPVVPVSVENAGWKIALVVNNLGNREVLIDKVFVDSKLVDCMGVKDGDKLSNTYLIGTSIPLDGLAILPGDGATFYVWIGSTSFNKGTTITIELQKINQFNLRKAVILN